VSIKIVGNEGDATERSVIGKLEVWYTVLRGVIRDHVTQQRWRSWVFLAWEQDLSHETDGTFTGGPGCVDRNCGLRFSCALQTASKPRRPTPVRFGSSRRRGDRQKSFGSVNPKFQGRKALKQFVAASPILNHILTTDFS
jgi:hypothetical protein